MVSANPAQRALANQAKNNEEEHLIELDENGMPPYDMTQRIVRETGSLAV